VRVNARAKLRSCRDILSIVMRGLDPRIHADWPRNRRRSMDCRVKPGKDGERRDSIHQKMH